MNKTNTLTKTLAFVGTALMWFPVVVPFLLSAVRLIQAQELLFDYLAPAELLPAVLLGGGLLLWAALRARSRRGLIAGALGAAVAFLAGGQVVAAVSGLDSGAIEAAGPWYALVLSAIVAYCLSVVVLAVAGVLLMRDLLERSRCGSGEGI
jgi:hypothetical protein